MQPAVPNGARGQCRAHTVSGSRCALGSSSRAGARHTAAARCLLVCTAWDFSHLLSGFVVTAHCITACSLPHKHLTHVTHGWKIAHTNQQLQQGDPARLLGRGPCLKKRSQPRDLTDHRARTGGGLLGKRHPSELGWEGKSGEHEGIARTQRSRLLVGRCEMFKILVHGVQAWAWAWAWACEHGKD